MTAAHTVTCPSCGGTIEIKAAGYTVNVGCQYCGSVLDVANPDVKVISEFQMAARKLELPLGSRGTIRGIEWEVIGYLERSDEDSNWNEYLLFNPYGGYRWLVRTPGYWSLGAMLAEEPTNAFGDAVSWNGKRFELDYNEAVTRTDYVLGEFYWRIKTGDTCTAASYDDNNEVASLSCEVVADETSWTFVEDIPNEAVEQAFKTPDGSPLPLTGGPAARAPSPAYAASVGTPSTAQPFLSGTARPKGEWGFIWKLSFGTLAACLVVMLLFGMGGQVAKNQIEVQLDAPARSYTLGTFTTTRSYQPITVKAASVEQFDNKWVDLDYSLVNKATQESIDGSGVVEHYSGVDSDGSWTEGSYSGTAKFAGVPAGTYDLVVEASMHTWSGSGSSSTTSTSTFSNPWGSTGSGEKYHIDIEASTGGVFWGNFWVVALLLLGVPLFMLYRHMKGGSSDWSDDD
jgi:hypothetical protein